MKPEQFTLKVFVYGTLKPGEANYPRYCDGYVDSQTLAYTKGILYDLPFGYPALMEGKNKIRGVLLSFNNSRILNNLDRLEGYHPERDPNLNEYYRRLVPVYSLGDRYLDRAWVYFMTPEKINQYGGILLESNCWRGC